MPQETLGALVRDLRLAKGWSQAELAERIGRSQRWVSDVERGVIAVPYLPALRNLADALGVSVTDLYLASQMTRARRDAGLVEQQAQLIGQFAPGSPQAGVLQLLPRLSPGAARKLLEYAEFVYERDERAALRAEREQEWEQGDDQRLPPHGLR